MKYLLVICFTAVITQACFAQTAQKVQMPRTFYKHLKGNIGDTAITIDLQRAGIEDSDLNGSLYYDKQNTTFGLYGAISPAGNIHLTATDTGYTQPAIFTGAFTAPGVIEGKWAYTGSKKQLPLKLVEDTTGLSATFTKYHETDCKTAEANKKHPRQIFDYVDTICSTLDLCLIHIKTANASTEKAINNSITRHVCEQYNDLAAPANSKFSSIRALLASVHRNGFMQQSIHCSVASNFNNITCIEIENDLFTGGAHGIGQSQFHNYDLETGKEIVLDDIINAADSTNLDKLAEKDFTAQNGSVAEMGWFYQPGGFPLTPNCAIKKEGLVFEFEPYEIGNYAMGRPQVLVTYKELRSLLKTNAFTKRMVGN